MARALVVREGAWFHSIASGRAPDHILPLGVLREAEMEDSYEDALPEHGDALRQSVLGVRQDIGDLNRPALERGAPRDGSSPRPARGSLPEILKFRRDSVGGRRAKDLTVKPPDEPTFGAAGLAGREEHGGMSRSLLNLRRE